MIQKSPNSHFISFVNQNVLSKAYSSSALCGGDHCHISRWPKKFLLHLLSPPPFPALSYSLHRARRRWFSPLKSHLPLWRPLSHSFGCWFFPQQMFYFPPPLLKAASFWPGSHWMVPDAGRRYQPVAGGFGQTS